MTCYACHSSWTTSCFGCHLPMNANAKKPMLHNEGLETRNYTSYNFEVLRDDIYMLGVDGTVTGHRIAPTRSTCAVVVSSQNANRDWLYYMQQTISAEGYSGFGFSSVLSAHSARQRDQDLHRIATFEEERQQRLDGATADAGHQPGELLGRYVYVAEGDKGFDAVTVAEHDDPPAIFGSDLQKIAYPANYAKFEKHGGRSTKRTIMPGKFSTCSCAANISTPPWARAGSASTTSPTSITRIFRRR